MSEEAARLYKARDRRLRRAATPASPRPSTTWTTGSTCSTRTTSRRSSSRTTPSNLGLEAAVQLALIGRYYERIGDHAVNIGNRVEYMVTGWLPEHNGAARVTRPSVAAARAHRAAVGRRGRRACASRTTRDRSARARARAVAGGRPRALAMVASLRSGGGDSTAAPRGGDARRRPATTRSPREQAGPTDARGAWSRRSTPCPRAWSSPTRPAPWSFRNESRRGVLRAPATPTRWSRRPSASCVAGALVRARPSARDSTCSARRAARSSSAATPLPSADAGCGALAVDRGRHRAPPPRGRAPRLRRQHQPRAEDAGRRARHCWPRRCWTRTTPPSPTGWPSGS